MWVIDLIPRFVWRFLGWIALLASILFVLCSLPHPYGIRSISLGEQWGTHMESALIGQLNQSPSYRNEPGKARAETWDWSTICMWGVLGFSILLALVFAFILVTTRKSKSKRK